PRDLDRVLHAQEQTGTCALIDGHREDVFPVEGDRAARDGVPGVTGDRVRQRGLAGAVGVHDGVRLTRVDGEGDAIEDRGRPGFGVDRDVQVADLENRHSDFLSYGRIDEHVVAVDVDDVDRYGLICGEILGDAGAERECG